MDSCDSILGNYPSPILYVFFLHWAGVCVLFFELYNEIGSLWSNELHLTKSSWLSMAGLFISLEFPFFNILIINYNYQI